MLQFVNPIPEAIRDQKALGDLLEKYNIVPYFGCDEYTSHSFIGLISDLSELSPSHQACKADFKSYAFGNCANIVAKSIAGFFDEEFDDEINRDEKLQFIEWLDSLGISLTSLIDCVNELNNALLDSGNAYLMIKIVTVGSTKKVFFTPLHYTQCGYLATKSGEVKKLINTEYWNEEWWKKKRPLLISSSNKGEAFNWDGREGGPLRQTVLHIRGDKGKSKYYGRSPIISVLYWMFVEHQLANSSVITSSYEYTSKTLLAFEEAKPERRKGTKGSGEAFRRKMGVLRRLATNEGGIEDAKTLAGVQYPHGGKPPTAIQLGVNRDTAYSQYQLDTATGLIHAVNKWDRTLTNIVTPKSNIGGNVYRDVFTIKNVSTIEPMQTFWADVLTDVFSQIAIETKYAGEVRSLKFKSAIDNLVDKLSTGNSRNNNLQNVED